MTFDNLIKGAIFFSWFMPSFTSLGFSIRQRSWQQFEPNFDGQNWLVTGASSGIGREIAYQAARAGATVYAVARSKDKLDELASQGQALAGEIVPVKADLSVLDGVDGLVAHLAEKHTKLQVLVNNVGLMLDEKNITGEGQEMTFATNVLGHFHLTSQLRDIGAIDDEASVINMSSGGMYNVKLSLKRLDGGDPYNGTLAYAYHKRALVVLNNWWRAAGLNSYVMHPGWVATPGVESAMPTFFRLLKPLLRDAQAGADTALWLAHMSPAQEQTEGIWFDRKLRREHFLQGTDQGASAEELLDFLQARIDLLKRTEQRRESA